MDTWLSGIIGAALLACFGYLIVLTREVWQTKSDVKECQAAHKTTCEYITKNMAAVPELVRQVDRLVYRQELADIHAIDGLHSPHAPERDSLLDRMRRGEELSIEDLERVVNLLRDARVSERSADKRWYATTLLSRAESDLHRKQAERE